MGDSETVVDASPNLASDTITSATGASGDLIIDDSMTCGQSLGDKNVENKDQNSAKQEVPDTSTHVTSGNPISFADESLGTSQGAAYDPSANGNDTTEVKHNVLAGISENGITLDVRESISEHHLADISALSAEEESLWNIVRANSLDFDAWTALIEETEKATEGHILKIRKVYDAFLAEFPLCYGYWKKYADHEERLGGSTDKVVEVYEQAVQGVTYSVDMWLHYCVFAINTYGDPDTVRRCIDMRIAAEKICSLYDLFSGRLFERGLAYVGTDYLSFPLWDKYIEYEYAQQEWSRLSMIYTRILEIPNQQLDRYFNSFRELVAYRPLTELRTAEEAAATAAGGGQENEGDVNPNVAQESSPRPQSEGLTGAEELEKYIAIREELYTKTKELDSKIVGFETAIRRPYFHFRPLSGGELENWHNYLDFIEAGDDFNKVVKLHERCLIACANYPEYWIRYALSMKASGSMDLAENALARATQVFVKRQPEIHLFAARFRERSGDISGARAAYQLVHAEISPGLFEAIIKHANMEHRLGNVEGACSLYEQAIAIEKGKEHSQTLPLLFAQYSRFVYLVSGNVEKSREVLDQALENSQLSKPLLEAMIHLESIQLQPKRIDHLDSLVEKFVVTNPDSPGTASMIEREELSSIFLEFLNIFGSSESIDKAEDRHAKLFLRHKSTTSISKKRQAEDFLISDKAKLAKSGGVISSSSPSVMGTYQSTQNQWAAASYGAQPQAWPPVTQAQGQNWNPAYTQQAAAYGAYGTTYTHPQIPSSVPQTAAYPPTYPVQQAYPQQNYTQAGIPATLTSLPQPAAVAPPAYYGNYY